MTRPLQSQTSDAPRNVMQRIGWNRRDFLRVAAGMGVSGKLHGFTSLLRATSPVRVRKAVVVTFGGGARDEETCAPKGQENIPTLLKSLFRSPLFIHRWLTAEFWDITWPQPIWRLACMKASIMLHPFHLSIPPFSSIFAKI